MAVIYATLIIKGKKTIADVLGGKTYYMSGNIALAD